MLVEPQHPGNVGAVARLLANFAAGPLVLVGGCAIDGEARARAIEAGANADTVEIIEVDEIPLAYMPGGAVRLRVKAVGDLAA